MKFNFKKIASVIATTVMLGSTVAFAAAAWPAPFVNNGAADSAVVYGATSADLTAAADLGAALDAKVTATGATIVSGGDSFKLERGSTKLNMGEALNSVYSSLDEDELSGILAKGTYLNDENTEYDYTQKIELGTEVISFYHDSQFNDDAVYIGLNMDRSDHILNYTLDFTPTNADGVSNGTTDEFEKIDNTNIEILGKTWFISEAEVTSNGVKLDLLDAANSAVVTEGETKQVIVGEKTYSVQVAFVENANTAKLLINGETTNAIDEGQTFKLSDGTYVGIKDVSYNSKDSGVSSVEFTLGTGKLELENNVEVQINDEDISELEDANGYSSVIKAYITRDGGTAIDKIVLEWNLNDDAWLASGDEIVMPGFNAIKISMGAWNIAAEEKTTIADGGDYVLITAPIKEGELKLPILYTNSSKSGFDGLGEEATRVLVTNASEDPTFILNETLNNYFAVTWISGDEAESYAYEIGSITSNSGKNTTKLTNLVSGGTDIEFSEPTDTQDVGEITFTLNSANDATGTVSITASGTEVYGNLLATEEGLVMKLPVIGNTDVLADVDGYIRFTNSTNTTEYALTDPTTWTMNFTEEDVNDNIRSGTSFTVTVDGTDTDGTQATDTSLIEVDEVDDSDWEIAYVNSTIATKVRLYNPAGSSALKKVEVIYPGAESSAEVFVTEAIATLTGSNNVKVVKDTEVDSVSSMNLVVVGGSCINTVAAKILGSETPICGDAFAERTGAGVGKYLIQVAASPYNAQKVAMLVAGYDAADTVNAVAKVKLGAESTEVGSKTVYPVASA